MYPFTYVRPDGTVAVTGASEVAEPLRIYNPTTQTWTTSDPNVVDGGSSAMYDTGKVIKAGSSYGNDPWECQPVGSYRLHHRSQPGDADVDADRVHGLPTQLPQPDAAARRHRAGHRRRNHRRMAAT